MFQEEVYHFLPSDKWEVKSGIDSCPWTTSIFTSLEWIFRTRVVSANSWLLRNNFEGMHEFLPSEHAREASDTFCTRTKRQYSFWCKLMYRPVEKSPDRSSNFNAIVNLKRNLCVKVKWSSRELSSSITLHHACHTEFCHRCNGKPVTYVSTLI